MVKKIYILDTCVLLHDSSCLSKFDEHEIILPHTVIEELDKFKKDQREVGRNARLVTRRIRELKRTGDITKGVEINNKGGILRSCLDLDIPWVIGDSFNKEKPDDRILNCAKYYNAILVTNDANLDVKTSFVDVIAEEYKNDKIDTDDLYSGVETIRVEPKYIDEIYVKGYVYLDETLKGLIKDLYPNLNIIMKDSGTSKQSALCRYDAEHDILKILPQDQKIMGILPKNTEQRFLLDMLLDPDIKLITVSGKAGCGKSLLSLLAALYLVTEKFDYKKLVVYRPIVPMGNELGFLPGDLKSKLDPWMKPISDNVEFIMSFSDQERASKKKSKNSSNSFQGNQYASVNAIETLEAYGMLEMDALSYIRGRSIPNQFILLDEGQNCSAHELRTLVTRAGEGTKIVITGDINQIDSPYLDSCNNGLSVIADKFKYEKIHGHICLVKSERSELAEIASNILKF